MGWSWGKAYRRESTTEGAGKVSGKLKHEKALRKCEAIHAMICLFLGTFTEVPYSCVAILNTKTGNTVEKMLKLRLRPLKGKISFRLIGILLWLYFTGKFVELLSQPGEYLSLAGAADFICGGWRLYLKCFGIFRGIRWKLGNLGYSEVASWRFHLSCLPSANKESSTHSFETSFSLLK